MHPKPEEMKKSNKITIEKLEEIMDLYFPDAFKMERDESFYNFFVATAFGRIRNADTIELAAARFAPYVKIYQRLCPPGFFVQYNLMRIAFNFCHLKDWTYTPEEVKNNLDILQNFIQFQPLEALEAE